MKWIAFLFLSLTISVSGQTPAYRHYGVAEGLPSNLVYHITQDSKGFLWFGTDKGLARYDGERFRVFTMEDGLPDREVLRLREDNQQRLWISCFRQKPCYYQAGTFYSEKNTSSLSRFTIPEAADFYNTANGDIWFSNFESDIFRIASGDTSVLDVHTTLPYQMLREFGGKMWTLNSIGITPFTNNQPASKPDFIFPSDLGRLTSFTSLDNRLLIAFSEGMILVEFSQTQFRLLKRIPMHALNVFADRNNRFWACEPGSGALCFNNSSRDLSNPVCYLPGKKVLNLVEDNQGTFWFNTQNEGVFALPAGYTVNWTSSNENSQTNITAITLDENGHLIAGDENGRLYRADETGLHQIIALTTPKGDNKIRQIIALPGERIWAITSSNTWYMKAGKVVASIKSVQTGAPKSIAWDGQRLWLASSGALGYIKPSNNVFIHIKKKRMTTVCYSADGNIWAGSTDGIYNSADSFTTSRTLLFPDLGSRIIDLQPAGSNYLWVCTSGKGLFLVKTDQGKIISATPVRLKHAGQGGNISAILPESEHTVWLATNQGINSVSLSGEELQFSTKQGLPDNEVNAVIKHGDTLWAATTEGLSRILLSNYNNHHVHFPTLITAISYFTGSPATPRYTDITGTAVSSPGALYTITIPSNANLLDLEFAGLNYMFNSNLYYEYSYEPTLLPLRSVTWGSLIELFFRGNKKTDILNEPIRHFGAGLTPGAWKISVNAYTTDGRSSDYPAVFNLQIMPAWYQTIWFSLLFAGLLVYGIWKLFNVQQFFHKMQINNAELQLKAVKARMNPHFIGNSIHSIQQFFYPPQPDKASRYIALFTSLLRRTLYYSEQNFIQFQEESDYQQDFLRMVQIRFGERFKFEINGTEDIPSTLMFPSMLIQPIIENATVHGMAQGRTALLTINYLLSGDRIYCTVTDNGPGIKSAQLRQENKATNRTPKGLVMIEEKINILNHLFHIDLQWQITDRSEEGEQGTRVSFSFLTNQKHLHQ